MFRRCLVLTSVLLYLGASVSASAAFAPAAFQPRTLASWEFSIHQSKLFPKTPDGEAFDSGLTALASTVEYTGRTRPLSKEKAAFLEKLGRTVLKRADLVALYKSEVEVQEGGLAYWVAVQEPVLPHLGAELREGEPFKAYYHFAGISRGKQPVYLLIEFDSNTRKN